eukprot:1860909-Prymnesium_polylepis.1
MRRLALCAMVVSPQRQARRAASMRAVWRRLAVTPPENAQPAALRAPPQTLWCPGVLAFPRRVREVPVQPAAARRPLWSVAPVPVPARPERLRVRIRREGSRHRL